jgi:cell division protein FtsA
LNHMSKLISDMWWEPNYEIIKIIPVQWVIDNEIKLKDPLWMEWKKLEMIADIFMIPKNFYNSLEEVFDKLEIWIVDIVPNLLWTAESVLDFDSKDLWTLLIDIGNNQTSFVVYEEWYPLTYWVVPLWGEDVTKDISIWLQMDIKDAETIKKEKGVVLQEDQKSDEDWIDIRFLSNVITARYEEIFAKIIEKLQDYDVDWKLPWWVILIWWWAKVYNVDKLAKEMFRLASFYWKDKMLYLWDLSANIQFIWVIGTLIWANKYSEEKSHFSFKFDFSFLKSIKNFLKKLF